MDIFSIRCGSFDVHERVSVRWIMTIPELEKSVVVLLEKAQQVEQENKQAFERIFGDEKTN